MSDQASNTPGQAPSPATQAAADRLAASLGGKPVDDQAQAATDQQAQAATPQQSQQPSQQGQQQQGNQNQNEDLSALPEWAQKVIRDTRREAAANRTRARELEEAQMTEQQRQQREIEQGREAIRLNLAYQVAAETGLPLNLAERLRGNSRDELIQDANTLRSMIPAGTGAPPPPDPSVFDAGARPQNGGAEAGDMNALLRSAAGRS